MFNVVIGFDVVVGVDQHMAQVDLYLVDSVGFVIFVLVNVQLLRFKVGFLLCLAVLRSPSMSSRPRSPTRSISLSSRGSAWLRAPARARWLSVSVSAELLDDQCVGKCPMQKQRLLRLKAGGLP